ELWNQHDHRGEKQRSNHDTEHQTAPSEPDSRETVGAQRRSDHYGYNVQARDDERVLKVEQERLIGQGINIVLEKDRIWNPFWRILKNIDLRLQRTAHEPDERHQHQETEDEQQHDREHAQPEIGFASRSHPDGW